MYLRSKQHLGLTSIYLYSLFFLKSQLMTPAVTLLMWLGPACRVIPLGPATPFTAFPGEAGPAGLCWAPQGQATVGQRPCSLRLVPSPGPLQLLPIHFLAS